MIVRSFLSKRAHMKVSTAESAPEPVARVDSSEVLLVGSVLGIGCADGVAGPVRLDGRPRRCRSKTTPQRLESSTQPVAHTPLLVPLRTSVRLESSRPLRSPQSSVELRTGRAVPVDTRTPDCY
jgi:hypothetical protein